MQPLTEQISVALVGPLPEPIGGVSAHVQRLAVALHRSGIPCEVVDIYPNQNKVVLDGIRHRQSPRGSLARGAWIFWVLAFGQNNIIHFHFSQMTGYLALLGTFLPKFGRKFVATLHHGDQERVYRNAPPWIQRLSEFALRRMDCVFSLSSTQKEFYLEMGIPRNLVVDFFSQMSIGGHPDVQLLPQAVSEIRAVEDGGQFSLVATSGYPSPVYNYEAILEAVELLNERNPTRLMICLYGHGYVKGYEDELRQKLESHPLVINVGTLPVEGFLAFLAKSSVYVRPSLSDSYGLAITDALDLGVPAIASDVCERDPRCSLFPSGSNEEFLKQLKAVLLHGRETRTRIPVPVVDAGFEPASFYKTVISDAFVS